MKSTAQGAWILLAALLASFLVTWIRFAPPEPRDSGAPSHEFSAERAFSQLDSLLGDVDTHPTGSVNNTLVRRRIEARLKQLGYEVSTATSSECNHFGQCMPVTNVMATLEGELAFPPSILLVAAHYDSVGAGQGASDDGVGVAVVLEAARAMRDFQPLHDVMFLLTDGEEMGLLGARAFMRTEEAKRVVAVVNVDNRGTSGPSLMFETSGPTSKVVPLLGDAPRPFTSSLFGGVYELLPNDTDFTAFSSQGAAGLNFAFIGDVFHYHTDRDDLKHVNLGSLQHHGDNVLTVARQLALVPGSELLSGERVVYFDWLGLVVLSWPEAWSFPLAVFFAMAFSIAAGLSLRKAGERLRSLLAVSLRVGLASTGAVALGAAMVGILWWRRSGMLPLHAELWIPLSFVTAATVLLGVVAVRRQGAIDPWVGMAGALMPAIVEMLVVSHIFPPASHLFIAPLAVATVALLVGNIGRLDGRVAASLIGGTIFIAGTMWFRVVLGGVLALNVNALPAVAFCIAMVAAPMLPMVPRLLLRPPQKRVPTFPAKWVTAIAIVVTLLGAATVFYPEYDEGQPQRQSLVHFSMDGTESEWWVDTTWGEPIGALAQAAGFGRSEEPAIPVIGMWSVALAPAAAPCTAVPTVVFEPSTSEAVVLRAFSGRAADMLGVIVGPGTRLAIGGHSGTVIAGDGRFAGKTISMSRGVPTDGMEVRLVHGNRANTSIVVFDVKSGLGPAGTPLILARGRRGVPSQEGDLSICAVTVPLDGEKTK